MPRKAKRGPKPSVPPKPGDPSSPTSPPTSPESPDPPVGAMATVSPVAMATASPIATASSVATTTADSCSSSTVSMATSRETTTSSSVTKEKSSTVTEEKSTARVTTAKKLSLCSDEELDALVKMNLPEASGKISPVNPVKSFKANLEPLSEDKDAEKTAEVSHKDVVLGSKMMIRTGVVSKKSSKVIKCSFNPESRDKATSLTDVWEESEPTSPDVTADVTEMTSLPAATSLDDISISERLQEVLDTSERMLYDIPPPSPSSERKGRKRFIRADSTDRRGSFFIKNTEDTDDPDAPLHSFDIGSAFYDDYEVDWDVTREDSAKAADVDVGVVMDTKCDERKAEVTVAKDKASASDVKTSNQPPVESSKTVVDEPIDVDNKKSEIVAMEAMLAARALSDIEKQIEDAMEDTQKSDVIVEEVPKSPEENVTDSGTGKKKTKRHKPAMGVGILSRENEGTPDSPETPTDKPLDQKGQTAEAGKQSAEATKPPDIVAQVEVTKTEEGQPKPPDVVADVAPTSHISPVSTPTTLAVPSKPKSKKKKKKKGLALDISGEATDSDAPETPVDVVPTQIIEDTERPTVVETESSPVDTPSVAFTDKVIEENYEVVSNVASSPIDVSSHAVNIFDDTQGGMKTAAKPTDSPMWVESGYPTVSSPVEEAQPEAEPSADIAAVPPTAAEPTAVVLVTKPKSKRKKKKKGGLGLDLGGASDVTDSDAPDTPVRDSPKTDSRDDVEAKSSPVDESTFVFVDKVQEEPKVIDMDAIREFVSEEVVNPALQQAVEEGEKAKPESQTSQSFQPELPKSPVTLVVPSKPKGKKKKKKGGLSLQIDGEATDSDAPITPSEDRPKQARVEVLTQSSPVDTDAPEFPQSQPTELVADVSSSPVEVSAGATEIFFSKDEPKPKLQEDLPKWTETGYATLSSPLDEAQKEFPPEDTFEEHQNTVRTGEVKEGPTPSSPVSPELATLSVPAKPKGKKRKKKKSGLALNVNGEATDSDAPETPIEDHQDVDKSGEHVDSKPIVTGEPILSCSKPAESPDVKVEAPPDEQVTLNRPNLPISPLAAPASPKPKGKKKRKKKAFPALDNGGDATDSDAPENPIDDQPANGSYKNVEVDEKALTSDVLMPDSSKAEDKEINKCESQREEPDPLSIAKSVVAPASPKPKGKKKKKKAGHDLELGGEATDSDAPETPLDEKLTVKDTDRAVVILDRTVPETNIASEMPHEAVQDTPPPPISSMATPTSPKPKKKKKKTGLTLDIGGDATDSDAPLDDKRVVDSTDSTAEVKPRIQKPEPKDDLDSLLMSKSPISPLFAPSSPRPKGRKKKQKRPKLGLDLSGDVTDSDAPDTPLEKLLYEFRTASTPVDSHTSEFPTTQEHTVTDVATSPIEVAPDAAFIFFPKNVPIKENDPRGDLFLPKWLEVGCPTLSTPVDEAVKEFPSEECQKDETPIHDEGSEQRATDTVQSEILSPSKLKGKKKRKKKVPGLVLDLGGEVTDSDAPDTPTIETMAESTEEAFGTQSSPVEASFPQSTRAVEPENTVVEVASSPVEVAPAAAEIFTPKKNEEVKTKDDDSSKWTETGYLTLSSPLDEAKLEFPDETEVDVTAKPQEFTTNPQSEELLRQIPTETELPVKKTKKKKSKKPGNALDIGEKSDTPLTPEPECIEGIAPQNKKPQAFYLDVKTGEMSDYDSDAPATPLTPKAERKLLQLQARHEKPPEPVMFQPANDIDVDVAEVPVPLSIEAVTEPGDEKQEKPVSAKDEGKPVKSPATSPDVLITKGKGKKKRKKKPGLKIDLGGEVTDSDAPDTPDTSEHKPMSESINESITTASSPVDSCELKFVTRDTETTVVEVASSPVEVSQDAACIFFTKPDPPKSPKPKAESPRWADAGYDTLSSPVEEAAKEFPSEDLPAISPSVKVKVEEQSDINVQEPAAEEPVRPPPSPKPKRGKKKKKKAGLTLAIDDNATDSDAPLTPSDEHREVAGVEQHAVEPIPDAPSEKSTTPAIELLDESLKEPVLTLADVPILSPNSPKPKGKKKKKKGGLTVNVDDNATDSDAPATPLEDETKVIKDEDPQEGPVSVAENSTLDSETSVVQHESAAEKLSEDQQSPISNPDVKTVPTFTQPVVGGKKRKKKKGGSKLDLGGNATDSDAPETPVTESKTIADKEVVETASSPVDSLLPEFPVKDADRTVVEVASSPVEISQEAASIFFAKPESPKKLKTEDEKWAESGYPTLSSPLEEAAKDYPDEDVVSLTTSDPTNDAKKPLAEIQKELKLPPSSPKTKRNKKKKIVGSLALDIDENATDSDAPVVPLDDENIAVKSEEPDKVASEVTAEKSQIIVVEEAPPDTSAKEQISVPSPAEVPTHVPLSPRVKGKKKKKKKGGLTLDLGGRDATDSDTPETPVTESKPVTDFNEEVIKTASSPVETSVSEFPVKDTETTMVEVASSPVEVSQEAASIFFAKPESPTKPKTEDEKWAESGYPTLSSPLEEAAKEFPEEDLVLFSASEPTNDAKTAVALIQAEPKLPPASPKSKRSKKKKKSGVLALDKGGDATDSDAPPTLLEEVKAEIPQEQSQEELSIKPRVERIEIEPENKPLSIEESHVVSPVPVLEVNKPPSSPKPKGKRKKKKGGLTLDVSCDAGTDSDAPRTPLEAHEKSVGPVEEVKTSSSPVEVAPPDPVVCAEPVAVEVASSPVDVAVGSKDIFAEGQPRTTIKVSEVVPKWTESGYPTSSSPLEEATKEFPTEETTDAVSSKVVQKLPASLITEQSITPASPKPRGKKKKKKKGAMALDISGEATDSDAPVTPDPPTKSEGAETKKPQAFYLDVKTGEMSDYDSDAPATPLTPKAQKKLLQLQARHEKPEELPLSEKALVEDARTPDDNRVQRPAVLEPILKNAKTKKPKAFVLDVKTGEISDYDSDAPEAPLTPGAQRKLMQLQARHDERKRNKSSEQGDARASEPREDSNIASAAQEPIPMVTGTEKLQNKPQAFCIDITTGHVSDYDSDADTPLTPRAKKKFAKLQERRARENVATPKQVETVDNEPVEEAAEPPDATKIKPKKPEAFVLDIQTGYVNDYDSDAETPLTPRARKKLLKLQARHDALERSPLSPKQKEPDADKAVEQMSESKQLFTDTTEMKKPMKPEAFYLDVQTGQMSDYDSDAPTTPLTPKAQKKFLQLRSRHEKKEAPAPVVTEPAEVPDCTDTGQVQKGMEVSSGEPPERVEEVKGIPEPLIQKPEIVSKEPKKNNVDIVADFTSEQPKVVLIKKAKKKKKKKGLKLNVGDGEGSEYTDSDAPETPTTNDTFKLPDTEATKFIAAATETHPIEPQQAPKIQPKERSSEKELHKMIADLTPEEMGLGASDPDFAYNVAVSKPGTEPTKKTVTADQPTKTKRRLTTEIEPKKTDSMSAVPVTSVKVINAAKDGPVASESSNEPELPPPPDSWVTPPPPPPPPQEKITTPPTPPPILHGHPKSLESKEHTRVSVQHKKQTPTTPETRQETTVPEPQATEDVAAPVPLEPKIWIKKNKKRKKKKLGLTLDLDAGSDYTDSDAPDTPSTPDSRPITEPVSPPIACTKDAASALAVPPTVNVTHEPPQPLTEVPKASPKPAQSPKPQTPPPVPPHATQDLATTEACPESKPPPVSPVRKVHARGPPPPPPVRVDSQYKPLSGQTQTSTVLPPEPKPITERPLSDAIVQTAGEIRMVTPTPAENSTVAVEAEMGPVQEQMPPPDVKPKDKNNKPLPPIPAIFDDSVGPVPPPVPVRKDLVVQKSPAKEPEPLAADDDIWQQLPQDEFDQLQRRKSGHILECVAQPLETVIGVEVEPVKPTPNGSQQSDFRPKSVEMYERVEQPLDTVIGVEVEKVEPLKKKASQRPPESQVRERPKSGEILECLEQPFDTVIGAIVEQVKSAKTKVSQRPAEERERPKSREILVDQPFDIVAVQQEKAPKRPSKKEPQKSPTKIVPMRPGVLPFGDPVTVDSESPVWVKRLSPVEDPPLSPVGPMQEDNRRKSQGDPHRSSNDELKPEAPEPRRHSEGARLRSPSGKSTGSSKSGATTSSEESSGQWEFPPFGPRASIPSRLAPPGAGDDSPIWVRRRVSEPPQPPKRSTSSSSEETRPRPVSAYLPGPEDSSDTAMLVAQVTRVHSAKSPIGQSSTIVEVTPLQPVQSVPDAVVSPEEQQAQQALPADDKKSKKSPPIPQAIVMPVQQQTFPETSKKAKKSPKRPKGMVLDFSKGGGPADTTDVLHVQTTLDLLSPCQDPMTTSDIKPDVSAPLAQHDDVTVEALTPVDQSRNLPGCTTSSMTSSSEQKDVTHEQIPSIFNKPADAKDVEKITDETNTSKPGGPVIMRRKSESNVREPGIVRKRFQKRKRPRSLILADDLREFDFADADEKIEPIQREPEWAPNAGLPLEDARTVLEQCRFLLKRDDVLSVHIGWKWVNLKRTREMAIIIGVPRKIAQSDLENKRALPTEVKVKMVSHDENVVIVTDVLEDEQLQRLYTKPQPIRGY